MVIKITIFFMLVAVGIYKIVNSFREKSKIKIDYYLSSIATYTILALTVYSLSIILVDILEEGKFELVNAVNSATLLALFMVLEKEQQDLKLAKKSLAKKELMEESKGDSKDYIITEYNPFIRFEKGKIKD